MDPIEENNSTGIAFKTVVALAFPTCFWAASELQNQFYLPTKRLLPKLIWAETYL